MKLIKCHIENFGKLSNLDYDFKDGLNTLKRENGYGKTTFASFIKAMFYGLDAKRNTKVLIDRKKYEPWQGGAFGGNIEIEVNGKKYKIERFFSKKEIDDTFKLYDLSTNLESNDYSQNIGEELFRLNKEAYERSTYISGQNIETSMNDSINAKLGNILESENDINSSEQAIKVLDEAIKNYKKTGGRGEINEKIYEKSKLEQKLEQSKIDEKALADRKIKYEEIKQKIKEKNEDLEKYQELNTLKIKEETKRILNEQYKNIMKNVEDAKENLEKYNNMATSYSELKEKIDYNEKKEKIIKEELLSLEGIIDKNKMVNKIILVLIIILSIISCVLFVKKINVILAVTIFATLSLFLVFIKNIFSKNKAKNSYVNKKKEAENLENLAQTLNSLYEKEQKDKEKEIERLRNDYELKLKIKNDFEIKNNIYELQEKDKIIVSAVINIQEIEAKIKELNLELNKLNDEKNYEKNQIEVLESNLDSVLDVENEIDELSSKIEQMKENCLILEKTKKYLQTAKEQFSTHYLGNMKESFVENINLLNGEELNAEIDVNLNAKINEQGSNKEIRYFSTGYKDLIYICMRLSLIEALFEEEKPFIILDDPFVNLDKQKIENALNLLSKISKDYQIIYFTCHESRAKI